MNNNEMISKIVTLTAIADRIENADVVNDIDRSIINHLTNINLPFAEMIEPETVVEVIAETILEMTDDLPAEYIKYLESL